MPYDEALAARVRRLLPPPVKVQEKKMMGGLTFMVNGKMCVGILNKDLMARIDPEEVEEALTRKGCREMDFTGKPMRGFVFVGPAGTATTGNLRSWIGLALAYNRKGKSSRRRES